MSKQSSNYDGIALTTPVSYGYSKTSEHSASWFIGSVLRELISQAGIEKQAVDGFAISSFSLQPDSVISLTQHFDMTLRWLEQLPYGGASGIIAVRRAARAIQSGDAEIVACIGGETAKQHGFRSLASNFSSFSNSAVYPYGAAGPNGPFALIARHYMDRYGISREDFGKVCLAQRYNANHYDGALLGNKKLSMDDYLNARVIAEPLHLFDCVMPCAGGEGFLAMSIDKALELGIPYVTVSAAEEIHNAYKDDPVQFRGGWEMFKDTLYQAAGLAPEDMNFVQTYDDYPVISIIQLQNLGFFEASNCSHFINTTPLEFDGGGLPHNTSGGQLSGGQAGAAAGYMGIVEAIRQLTRTAERNQVPDAKVGLVSGYGMINYDRGLCSVATILQGMK
jgi:acetyl-CoA acetyltransferase